MSEYDRAELFRRNLGFTEIDMKLTRGFALVPIAAAFLVGFSQPSHADFSWNLTTLTNGTAPSGSTPWMTATFADTATNEVTMTLTNLMGGDQFIDEVVFNVAVDPATLTVARLDAPPPGVNNFFMDAAQIYDGGSQLKAGMFNMFIDFYPPTGGPIKVFNSANGPVIYTFTGAGLDSTDFMMLSTPQPFDGGYTGAYYMAAHIQGIPAGTGSGTIAAIPEPETYAMLLAGLGLMGFIARRRKRKLSA